jgi:hypothetical protein
VCRETDIALNRFAVKRDRCESDRYSVWMRQTGSLASRESGVAFREGDAYDAPMSQEDRMLVGGRTTAAVTRVGETIRRPPAPNAGFVRSLLRHLEVVGFDGAPQYRGTDARGREMLTYVPGEVPADLGNYDDERSKTRHV